MLRHTLKAVEKVKSSSVSPQIEASFDENSMKKALFLASEVAILYFL